MSVVSDEQNMDEQVCVYPTSYSQQGIWFINQMDPESAAYCIPFAYRIRGGLAPSALEKSINEIVRRHEAFRTTFRFIGDSPVQVVAPTLRIELPLVDLSGQADDERNSTLSRLLDEESVATFDLTNGPLLRASIIRLSADEHVLLLNIHHIILDHLSVVQFARELTTLYSAYSEHTASSLAEPILHYSDYAVWQKEWQSPEALSAKLSFWEQQKELLDNVLQLPTDSPRPAVQTFGGVEARISLPLPLVTALRELGRNEAVSMFIMMLAAYKVLLHRYTDQSIISVGCPYANRGQQIELEEVMGCFINTLPLVSDFSGQPTFRDVLKSVRKSVFSVNAHQEVPFELIVEELQPTRDMSYNPMFQVGFLLQDPPMELKLHGLEVTSFKLHNKSAKFDMMIWLWDSADDAIEGTLEYNTDLWGEQSIQRFIGHYQALLESIVSNPDQTVDQFSIMNEDERHRLLVEWNDTPADDHSSVVCFHELITAHAMRMPDGVALQYGDEQLTYGELDRHANQLAHYLIQQGVKTESLVAICMDRSVRMVVTLLAILKAGGAYLPLDPAFPKKRLAFMLEDANVILLLTESAQCDEFPQVQVPLLCVDTLRLMVEAESEVAPVVEVDPDSLAYVIYTSGSTGKPKGVQISHSAVLNFLNSMARRPGFESEDVLVAVTTLSFDIAVLELYLPLIRGGKCVVASREVATDGKMLLALLETSEATVMQATPTTWRLLIAAGWQGSEKLKVLCGGEAMPRDLIGELILRSGSVWNMYGPTETTVWSTCYQLTDSEGLALIGRPVDNTRIYILDKRMALLPAGVFGEIYIGGSGVARGYLNREELTAECFVADPFSDASGTKLYRTGDLGRYLADGNIEYQSRNDGQVKVRGFRIELGDIESNLVKQQALALAVVVVREDYPGDKRLVAYVVFKQEQSATENEMRGHLRGLLPEYMIPQHFVELENIPLTPNGKVDRKELPGIDAVESMPATEFVAATTEVEKKLTSILVDVLGVERLGLHTNFFEVGGHSLLMARVISMIREQLGVEMPLRIVFEMPTILAIAQYLEVRLNLNASVKRADGETSLDDDDREEVEF